MFFLPQRMSIRFFASLASYTFLLLHSSFRVYAGEESSTSLKDLTTVPPPFTFQKMMSPAEKLTKETQKYRALEAFSKAFNTLQNQYVEPSAVAPSILIEKALKGMTSDLDPHTTYLTPAEYEELTGETRGRFGGIGVVLQPFEEKIKVVEVIEDSPAEKAGIRSGDIIVAIDNTPLTADNFNEVLTRLRGLPGTTLEITYQRLTEGKKTLLKNKNVSLIRQEIQESTVTSASLAAGYGYVKVIMFREETSTKLTDSLQKLMKEHQGKLHGLILDLRNNPGGLLDQAVKVANLFIDSGILVSTVSRDHSNIGEVGYASRKDAFPYFPLVVLVNEQTASASEIVAGALQDRERAIVMGSRTYGKGSVQSVIPLANGGALKFTIARYYTPDGKSVQARGILPDIPLTNARDIDTLHQSEKARKKDLPREANLQHHIQAQDQQTYILQQKSQSEIDPTPTWPDKIQKDTQIHAAFFYLRNLNKHAELLNNMREQPIIKNQEKIL